MANRGCNQEVGKRINTKQNTDTNKGRGDIGDRSSNLIKLIGAERVSRRDFKYEGTYYVTEDGELYGKEDVSSKKLHRPTLLLPALFLLPIGLLSVFGNTHIYRMVTMRIFLF